MNTRALCLLCLLWPGIAVCQETPRLALRLDFTNVWARSDFPGSSTVYRGPTIGGEGRLALAGGKARKVFLSARYMEGKLSLENQPAAAGTAPNQEFVQGALAAIYQPTSWFEVSFGPQARAYSTDAGTERWIAWSLRSRVQAPLIARRLTSYFELWKSLSSSLNIAPGAGRVQGGETGLRYEPPGSFGFSLSYHIDDALFKSPGQSETVEWLSAGIRWGAGW